MGSSLAVGFLGAFMGVICFLALRGLQNPVRVDSVSAGGAAVSLRSKENSYLAGRSPSTRLCISFSRPSQGRDL